MSFKGFIRDYAKVRAHYGLLHVTALFGNVSCGVNPKYDFSTNILSFIYLTEAPIKEGLMFGKDDLKHVTLVVYLASELVKPPPGCKHQLEKSATQAPHRLS